MHNLISLFSRSGFPASRFSLVTTIAASTLVSTLTAGNLIGLSHSSAIAASPNPSSPHRLSQAKNSVWRTFTPPGGGFSILMPGTPKQQKAPVNSTNMVMNLFVVERPQEKAGYLAAYMDIPGTETLTGAAADRAMEQGAAAFLQATNSAMTAQQTLTLNGFPGYEMRIKNQSGAGTGRLRMFMVNRRLYMLMAITTQEKALSKSIDGFMRSFKLTWN